jgi:hypothetical protein
LSGVVPAVLLGQLELLFLDIHLQTNVAQIETTPRLRTRTYELS